LAFSCHFGWIFPTFLCKTHIDNKYKIVILDFINEDAELARGERVNLKAVDLSSLPVDFLLLA
jgi:hypothetical protein